MQDLPDFRKARPEMPMPRVLFIVDEFQELFVEDDKLDRTWSPDPDYTTSMMKRVDVVKYTFRCRAKNKDGGMTAWERAGLPVRSLAEVSIQALDGADPGGPNRDYSAPRRYRIDPRRKTAVETWRYEHGRTLDSPICSSVYEVRSSLLVDYPHATDGWVHLVGLRNGSEMGFEYRWPKLENSVSRPGAFGSSRYFPDRWPKPRGEYASRATSSRWNTSVSPNSIMRLSRL